MKKNYILGAFAAASLAFTACSSDDLNEDLQGGSVTPNVPEEQTSNGFKELGTFALDTKLGNLAGGSAESRTPGDIDEFGRPTGVYPLRKVGQLSLVPEYQPTSYDKGKLMAPWFSVSLSKYQEQPADRATYKLYYKILDEGRVSHKNEGASESGVLQLSYYPDGRDPLYYDLTVFSLDKLQNSIGLDEYGNEKHIALNDFAYNVQSEDCKVKGTSLRYISYKPSDIPNEARENSRFTQSGSKIKGKYLALPEIDTNAPEYQYLDFLKNKDYDISSVLVNEIQDNYFVGDECLFAADGDSIYILTTNLDESETGGYYYGRKYPSPDGVATPNSVTMSRMTTIVNTSFMIVDKKKWDAGSYFVPTDEAKTLKNFKRRFGVDLSDLTCPYATFDGFNTRYFVNEIESTDKTDSPARMVMWAPGLKTIGANGIEYERKGERSMNINYNLDDSLQRGYGIKGNSYVVAFPGSQEDTKGKLIQFYVNVDGANVLIQATIDKNTGIAFSQNTAHNVTVFVDAQKFANAVKRYQPRSRANGADDYVVVEVSGDDIVVTE